MKKAIMIILPVMALVCFSDVDAFGVLEGKKVVKKSKLTVEVPPETKTVDSDDLAGQEKAQLEKSKAAKETVKVLQTGSEMDPSLSLGEDEDIAGGEQQQGSKLTEKEEMGEALFEVDSPLLQEENASDGQTQVKLNRGEKFLNILSFGGYGKYVANRANRTKAQENEGNSGNKPK